MIITTVFGEIVTIESEGMSAIKMSVCIVLKKLHFSIFDALKWGLITKN